MIYIYSQNHSTRLVYTLDVLIKNILQVDYLLVDKDTFIKETTYPKINYSDNKIKNSIWISAHNLLFEKNITRQDIAVTHLGGIPFFFKTSQDADIVFDIFASSFYMLSRYEEYLPFSKDAHGRFTAKESLAYKANFLQKPVVHLWANLLQKAILKQKPNFLFPTRIFTQLNSIDIDIAYAFKGKSFARLAGGFIKSVVRLDFRDLSDRISYMFGAKDPYDTYQILKEVQDQSNANTIYFFQVGKQGTFDKNLSLNKVMKQLILKVSKYVDLGIHPSYQSNKQPDIIEREKTNLSNIIAKPITKSRQHFLKMSFPNTYENLISVGITDDYSLGFSDQIGFRAGMAIPFPFFNLINNQQRPLIIHPFQVMDGTLKDYMQLSPKEAIAQANALKKTTKKIHGEFVSIFHNSSVTDQGSLKGWLAVYQSLFD
jgi:hypothetical protein